jgi:hypothetical protein
MSADDPKTTEIPSATGDWRDVRAALLAVEPDFYAYNDQTRRKLWASAEGLLKADPRRYARCVECDGQHEIRQMYRCTDCGSWMCNDHWKRHFGPDHKPHGGAQIAGGVSDL